MTEHTDELSPAKVEAFVNACRELSDEAFLFIPGFEVPYQHAHVLMVGSTNFVTAFADAADLKKWAEGSAVVVLAHPVRNSFKVDETLLSVIDGIEVWNQQYDGKRVPRAHSVRLLNECRQRKEGLRAFGGLDFHRKEHYGSPILSVNAVALTESEILYELHEGSFCFGSDTVRVYARGEWRGGLSSFVMSAYSVAVIMVGKSVNAVLKSLGLSLPKKLRQTIRSKI
jgi:hypothetical protein